MPIKPQKKPSKTSPPDLAVIVPAFCENEGLIAFYDAVKKVLDGLNCTYIILFIDDGSKDETWEVIETLAKKDKNIHGLRFSRNFGKEYAILAGLKDIEAKHYLVIDSDLQHPPARIPDFWARMQEGDVEIVEGIKTDRGQESAIYKFCSKLFYNIVYLVSRQNFKNSSDFKLLTQRARNSVLTLDDGSFFFRAACQWVGFPKAQIDFNVDDRQSGSSKFSLRALLQLMNNAILSNTKTLLRLATLIGLFFGAFAFILSASAIWQKITGQATSGFTTIILFLSIQACFTFLSIGILGEYLARIYKEVKKYPNYIVGERTDD